MIPGLELFDILKKEKKKKERNCEANGISNDVEVWS